MIMIVILFGVHKHEIGLTVERERWYLSTLNVVGLHLISDTCSQPP